MKIVLNNFQGSIPFKQALSELIEGADRLSIAVSYLQPSGWALLQTFLTELALSKTRLVCTDQMGITAPAAVQSAMQNGMKVRLFTGDPTYHPKMYLAHDVSGKPIRVLFGSANLSGQAFSDSVEVGILSEDQKCLDTLNQWFEALYQDESMDISPELLEEMKEKWKAMAAARAQAQLQRKKSMSSTSVLRKRKAAVLASVAQAAAEDADILEDVLATIQFPVGLLNFDYGGNTLRNIDIVRTVLAKFPEFTVPDKHPNELKLLGFMWGGELTELGYRAANAKTNEEFAMLWFKWLKNTSDDELIKINKNGKLLIAKHVFSQFWKLKNEVQDYFLENAQSPSDRMVLQTIELLCNAQAVVQELSLDEIKTLSALLRSDRVPEYVRKEIDDYFKNKGNRGWDFDDRRVLPLAWKEAG